MRFPTDSLSSPPGGEAVYSRKNERKAGKGRWRFGSLLFDQDFCNFFFFLLLFNHASQFRFLNYFNILNSLETNLYVDVIFDLTNLSGKQGILDVRWKHFFPLLTILSFQDWYAMDIYFQVYPSLQFFNFLQETCCPSPLLSCPSHPVYCLFTRNHLYQLSPANFISI